jgi:hypothetical protein
MGFHLLLSLGGVGVGVFELIIRQSAHFPKEKENIKKFFSIFGKLIACKKRDRGGEEHKRSRDSGVIEPINS